MYVKVFYKIVFTFVIFNANGVQQGRKLYDHSNPTGNPVYDEAGILLQEDGQDAQNPENSEIGQDKNNIPDAGNFPGEIPPENFAGNRDGPNAQKLDMGILSSEIVSPDGKLDALDILDRNKPEPGFDLTQKEIRKFKLWPGGFIPYYIDVMSFSDKVLRDKIRSYLSTVNSLTSLNFVEIPSPPTDNSRYVFFVNRQGLLGCGDHSILDLTLTGAQHVVLGYHCMSTQGELAEAVLTIAGVPPMHNAPGRDYYIKVNDRNIMPDKKYLFRQLDDTEWLFHDLDYDFESAGHYNSYRYSINGRATIEPQDNTEDVTVGETTELSPVDILKIRMLYNYIVRKKMLQGSECHRLFEPGSKFKEFKPSKEVILPRAKPARYTGDTENARPDTGNNEPNPEDYEPSPGVPDDNVANDSEYQNEDDADYNDALPDDIPPDGNDIPSYDFPPDNTQPKDTFTTQAVENSFPPFQNEDDDVFDYINKGEGPPIINIHPHEVLKYSTRKVDPKEISLKSPKQSQKYNLPDKISVLSDFGTSHEANKRYENVNEIKEKTLHYGQQDQRFGLKFRGVG